MYEVRLPRRANRYYQRVDQATARRLDRCFEELSINPFGPNDVRPIRGRRGLYRFRIGDLRVLFTVDEGEQIVTIPAIGPRGDIY